MEKQIKELDWAEPIEVDGKLYLKLNYILREMPLSAEEFRNEVLGLK